MSDTMHPMFEQRQYPRRKVHLFVTAQINDLPPIPMHSLDVSRNGLCVCKTDAPIVLAQSETEDPGWTTDQNVELCFEIYPISVWGSIVRVSPDGQTLGISIARTSDDTLWQSITEI